MIQEINRVLSFACFPNLPNSLNTSDDDEDKQIRLYLGGDMATTRRYLDMASRASSTLVNNDTPITPININCLDPLGRSALLIGIISTRTFEEDLTCFFLLISN